MSGLDYNSYSKTPSCLESESASCKTIRCIVDNMKFPLTLKTFNKVFSKIGEVMKIVLFTKNNQLQALIQFHDADTAKRALLAMDNKNIYDGCCSLRIDYSKIEDLAVKYNNEKTWDYTKPDLPTSGPESSSGSPYKEAVEYHRGNMRESNDRFGGDDRGRNEKYRGRNDGYGGGNEGYGGVNLRGKYEGYGGRNEGYMNQRNEGYGEGNMRQSNEGYGGGNMRGMGAMGYGGGNMRGSNERYGEGNMRGGNLGYGGRNEGYGGDMRERNERFGGGDMRVNQCLQLITTTLFRGVVDFSASSSYSHPIRGIVEHSTHFIPTC